MSLSQVREILASDLDPDFLETLAIKMGWGYPDLFRSLAEPTYLPDHVKEAEFNRRRALVGMDALVQAAQAHGIPGDFCRLDCNGQTKFLVKAGRVILILEPVLWPDDKPNTADYKVDLASANAFVRQLEFDFGDLPGRICDWSGCVLAAVLHGPTGKKFTLGDKSLGTLMLAVPDAAYREWTVRIDLRELALYGRNAISMPAPARERQTPVQEDRVTVTLKRKNRSASGET